MNDPPGFNLIGQWNSYTLVPEWKNIIYVTFLLTVSFIVFAVEPIGNTSESSASLDLSCIFWARADRRSLDVCSKYSFKFHLSAQLVIYEILTICSAPFKFRTKDGYVFKRTWDVPNKYVTWINSYLQTWWGYTYYLMRVYGRIELYFFLFTIFFWLTL